VDILDNGKAAYENYLQGVENTHAADSFHSLKSLNLAEFIAKRDQIVQLYFKINTGFSTNLLNYLVWISIQSYCVDLSSFSGHTQFYLFVTV